jgi:hypothetical protein
MAKSLASAIFRRCFPKFSPANRRINARGAFSRPSIVSSLHESAFPLPAAQCLNDLGKTRAKINPSESLHASTPCYKVEVIRRARLRSVRSGYGTVQNDARLEVDAREYLVEDGPADIVEEDVDPIGTKLRKSNANVLGLVVDSGVEMRLLDEPIAFFSAARRTNDAAALDLRDLARNGTQTGPLGDDAQIAKSGELPLKALVRVDAIRKACLTNLDCALDCLFTEVEHPVYERPVCNLVVGRGMQAIAANH